MGKELSILFVSNATRRQADAIVTYNVKMVNIADSKAIRLKFGSFFLGGKDKRPDCLKPFSIKNVDVLFLQADAFNDLSNKTQTIRKSATCKSGPTRILWGANSPSKYLPNTKRSSHKGVNSGI